MTPTEQAIIEAAFEQPEPCPQLAAALDAYLAEHDPWLKRERAMVELYEQEKQTFRKIGERFGVSCGRAREIVRHFQVMRLKEALNGEDEAAIEAAYIACSGRNPRSGRVAA